MTHPPRLTDESVLARWIALEITKMNGGMVKERKSLSLLLGEDRPVSVTMSGDVYSFDADLVRSLGSRLPEELHRRLKLPILFYASPGVPDSCSCADAPALSALQALGEVSALRTMQGNRFWVSRPIAYAIIRKYPSVVQIVMGL